MTADGRFIAITPEIEALAKGIQVAFLDAREQFVPGARGRGKRDDYIKAALLCKELGETPDEFVQRQMPWMAERNVWYASTLSSVKAVETRQAKAAELIDDSLSWYQSQLHTMQARLEIFKPRDILEDPTSSFSPLFRCVMALRFGEQDIVEGFRKDALLELAANPIARELFSEEVGSL